MGTVFTFSVHIICFYTELITLQIHLCASLNFIQSPTQMPIALDSFAIGYDAINHTILLLGGGITSRQLTLFQIKNGNTFVSRGSTFLPSAHATWGWGQHYTQINDQLWMLDENGETFIRMDLKTYTSYSPSTTLPISVPYDGCLTSYDDHLIVIYEDVVQIYKINDNQWLSNLPRLQNFRYSLPCAVVNNHAYAIGGEDDAYSILDTIEVLDLSNINIDSFNPWYYFSDTLTLPTYAGRSVVHGTDIYVIGGCIGTLCEAVTTVGIINTITGQYNDISDSLAYGVAFAPSIIVGDTLYVFGGCDRGSALSLYQYSRIPTPNPTMQPTEATEQPTKQPSESPTQPTKQPTKTPSEPPTKQPTESPTPPTKQPTEPTRTPTSLPSSADAPTPAPSTSSTTASTVNTTEAMHDRVEGDNESSADILLVVLIVVVLILIGAIGLVGCYFDIERRKRVQDNQTMVQKEVQQGAAEVNNNNVSSDITEEDERMDNEEDSIDSLYINKGDNQEQTTGTTGGQERDVLDSAGALETGQIEGKGEDKVEMGYTHEGGTDMDESVVKRDVKKKKETTTMGSIQTNTGTDTKQTRDAIDNV
eukprot:1086595_1